MPWGALIGAAASLIGGSRADAAERRGIREQNAYNDPQKVRERAEAAGFNPLLFVGPGVGNQTQAATGGGFAQGVADAGMALGSALDQRSAIRKQNEELEKQNEELRAKLSEAARPPIAGIYAPARLNSVVPHQQPDDMPAVASMDPFDPSFIGPLPAVNARNLATGEWMEVDPLLADQLQVPEGGWVMGDHFETMQGGIVGEAVNVADNAVGMATGVGGIYDGALGYPSPPDRPPVDPDDLPNAFGMTQEDIDARRDFFVNPWKY